MNITCRATDIFVIAWIVLGIAWELLTVFYGEKGSTISERVWNFLKAAGGFGYVAVFIIGILFGHFLWQRDDKVKSLKERVLEIWSRRKK